MKVVEIQSFGIDELVFADRPEPKPKAGQVVIRIKAASLNFRDLMMVKGIYNPKLRRPLIPLSDGVGEIVEIGEGVTRVKVGDRVAGIFMQRWIDGQINEANSRPALGGDVDGMLAEFVCLDQEGVVHLPDFLSDEEAATLPCAAVTTWDSLIDQGKLKSGDTVLIQGTGGVSIFALQIARMAGARVIATSSSDEKLERVKAMGASDGINYKATPDWDDRVRQLTGGIGVDHIVEVGGAGTLARSFKAVRKGGHISLIGVLAGATAEVNPMPILMKNIRVQGIFVGSRRMFEDMNRAITLNNLKPVVDRVFDFKEIKEALKYMENGAHFGKICIRM
jgi:NADPH:quinone reductase-like Zn-dependent oxidoreductase